MPEQEEGTHGVPAEGEWASCNAWHLSFAGADVLCNQEHHQTLYNLEKVEGPMFSSTELRSRVLINPVAQTWNHPFWSLVATTVFWSTC